MALFLCGLLQIVSLHLLVITNVHASLLQRSWDTCHFGSVECKCQKVPHNLLKVDCSEQRLLSIPTFTTNVIWIDLSNNYIDSISSGFPRNVSYINLSGNQIMQLDKQPFRGLFNLKTLNLERNWINITLMYKGLFADLHSLTELSLKGNVKDKSKVTVLKDEVFSELRLLETLKIDGPTNLTFGKGFRSLTRLKKLDLSGITGNCSLKKISHDMFLNLPQLSYVDVSACDILDIEEGSFGELQNLEHLDVSHNKQLGFASLPNITHNLNKTLIKKLRGNGINCLSGIGTRILKRHFENLKHTNISEIYFEKNRLELVEFGALRLLQNALTILSLGENKLTQGKYILDYFSLQNLRVLNVSVQLRPPPYPESIFEHCIEKTDISYSNQPSVEKQEKIEYEPMLNDFMSRGPWQKEFLVTIDIPKSLEVLYANMSRLYRTIPKFGLNATGLREMYFQDNFFYSWDGPVHGLENITIIDLSNNYCSHISKLFLKYARGLTMLNMSKNDIGQSLSKDVEGEIFENTVSLEVLDLSYNNIFALSAFIFKNMTQLRILNLQNNQLSTWRVKMNHMKNMKFVNLKQNKLTTFEKTVQTSFENLFQTSNLTIDLSENQVLCSCENAHFLEWITHHKTHFMNLKRYECSLSSSQKFNFSDAITSTVLLKENCESNPSEDNSTTVFLIYISGAVVIVTILLSVFIYLLMKYKWRIKHSLFEFKQLFCEVGYSANNEQDYDAMISYSDKDLPIVLKYLVPNLESNTNLRLFVRHRDDPQAGMSISAIKNAIENSRCAVCLVTENYLKSKRQDYELNMIIKHMERHIDHENEIDHTNLLYQREDPINNHENFICRIVRFQNVSIPNKISNLDNNMTVFPEEDSNYEEFWKTLRIALRRD